MSTKRASPGTDSTFEGKPDDTIRTSTIPDGLPDYDTRYIEPSPVPAPTEHKTIDMVPVRLAPDVDPRLARTERLSIARTWRSRKIWVGAALALLVVLGALASVLVPRLRARSLASAPSGEIGAASVVGAPPLETIPPATLSAPLRKSEPPRATAVTALPRARMKPAPIPSASASARSPKSTKDVWLE